MFLLILLPIPQIFFSKTHTHTHTSFIFLCLKSHTHICSNPVIWFCFHQPNIAIHKSRNQVIDYYFCLLKHTTWETNSLRKIGKFWNKQRQTGTFTVRLLIAFNVLMYVVHLSEYYSSKVYSIFLFLVLWNLFNYWSLPPLFPQHFKPSSISK